MSNIAQNIQSCADHIIDDMEGIINQGRDELLHLPAEQYSSLNEPTIKQFLYKKIHEKIDKKIIHQIK